MGLSDEERFAKIAHTINGMVSCTVEYRERLQHTKDTSYLGLVALVDQLWPTFLSKSGNSGYWLFGGSMSTNHLDSMSLVGVAFRTALDGELHSDDRPQDHEDELSGDDKVRMLLDQYQVSEAKLLPYEENYVLTVYQWTEQYFYAANRYQDDFAAGLQDLSGVMAKIQGYCFDVFSHNSNFVKAYCLVRVTEAAVGHNPDLVTRWWTNEYLWHGVELNNLDTEDVLKLFKESQTKKWTVSERLWVVAQLLGGYFGLTSKHHQDRLKQAVQTWNESQTDDQLKVPDELPTRMFDHAKACEAAKASLKVADERYAPYCALTDQKVTRPG